MWSCAAGGALQGVRKRRPAAGSGAVNLSVISVKYIRIKIFKKIKKKACIIGEGLI